MVSFWLVFAVDYLRQRGDWVFLSFYCCDFYIGAHTWDGICIYVVEWREQA